MQCLLVYQTKSVKTKYKILKRIPFFFFASTLLRFTLSYHFFFTLVVLTINGKTNFPMGSDPFSMKQEKKKKNMKVLFYIQYIYTYRPDI